MNEILLTEFSLLYKRLTRIEYELKNLIYSKYTDYYGKNAYTILYRYFNQLDTNRKENIKTFQTVFKSQKSNQEKLNISISKMYLRETLLLFSNYVFIKNKIRKSFWDIDVDVKSSTFQKNQKSLKELRNCVAHFNHKKYMLEKTKFLTSLIYFEQIIGSDKTIWNDSIIKQIKSSKKLSIKSILKIILEQDKKYFKNDKLLLSLFDDIAILNGYTYQTLPQRWSIIRQKYEIEKL